MRILIARESDRTEVDPHQSHHLMERLSHQGHEVRWGPKIWVAATGSLVGQGFGKTERALSHG